MKKFISVCLSCLVTGTLSLPAQENPREIFWENALPAVREKPRDAIAAFDDIAVQAAQAGAWDEYALALCMRTAARARIEGNDASVDAVRELQRAVADAPSAEARAFLAARLAYAYRSLAQSPRFGQMRPQTPLADGESKSDDVTTWSDERIAAAALAAYKSVFDDAGALKKIPVATFAAKQTSNRKILKAMGLDRPLPAGNSGSARIQNLRGEFGLFSLNDSPAADFPTLYDFFAQDAVKFYSALSRRAPESEKAQKALLDEWKEFHANDADKSAYARAVFAGISSESDNYEAELKNFTKEFSYYPIASEAFAKLAQNAIGDARREEAFLFAKDGYEKYRQHKNSAECAAILDSLTSKGLGTINTESTWFDAESATLFVRAKNVEKLHFRAVPWDWQDFLRRERNRPNNLSKAERKEILLSDEGAITWSQELEKFTDFAEHEFTVPAPFEKFEPGFYFITASADPNFKSFDGDRIPYMTVWVSDIAVITESIPRRDNAKEARTLRGYVVNVRTGEPLENVEIAAWNKVYGGDRVPVESVKSAADGSFELPGLKQDFVALAVAPDGNAVSINENTSWQGAARKPDGDIGKLFTDRAIYRPGQLIHFKGIRARYDADKPGSEKILPGEKVEVKLFDANNKEVAQSECYTNAFGSFAGTFTAPAGLLKGVFTLKFDKAEKEIRIEEYKRPKFELTLEAPEKQIILGQTAEMLVNAKAFTGMPLDSAKISWTVTEDSYEDYGHFEENVITRGNDELDADGNFKIAFPTKTKKLSKREARKLSPTEKLEAERELSRNYSIEIAVTDSTGETHTKAAHVKIGNCGVRVHFSSNDKGFSVETTTLSGKPIAVPATLCIYERELPEKIERRKPDTSYRYHASVRDNNVKRGKKLFEKQFKTDNTNQSTTVEVSEGALPKSGAFVVVVSGKDAFARPFESESTFEKLDASATRCPIKLPFLLSVGEENVTWTKDRKVGETFTQTWGSGYESARARVEIFKKGKLLKSFWTQKGNTQEIISVPVTQELIGGFSLRISQMRNGQLFKSTVNVHVPEPDKELKIEWQRFRSKLVPGGAEVWTARVTLPDGTPANAEMLALLYDRSLDSFTENWQQTDSFKLPEFDSRNRVSWLYHSNQSPARLYGSDKFPQTPYAGKEYYRPLDWLLPYGYARRAMMQRSFAVGADNFAPQAMACVAESPANTLLNDEDCKGEAVAFVSGAGGGNGKSDKKKAPPATPRKNLQETAFFQPFINTDASGIAQITFVVPEALTGWRFIAFAHDKELRSGSLEDTSIVTEKPLMAQPNAPRFLREGDVIEFPVKISNSGKTPLKGTAQLAFNRADDGKDVFAELCDEAREQSFDVPAGASRTLTWKIRVPETCEFLTYRATARAEEFSDGEEALLPILPKKITVTESANFLVRAGTQREATLFSLTEFADKKPQALNIDVNADPAWDAFLALPRLALLCRENDSSDSIFYRFYTNKLAEKIAKENPAYRRKFEALTALGNNAQDLRSPLAQDSAKNIALEATPFITDADDETAQRRAVAQLFDRNTMSQESERALATLRERLGELKGDGWSWFPGAQSVSPRITRTILIGLARLVEIGALDKSEIQFAQSAIRAQDARTESMFNRFDEKGLRTPAPVGTEIADWLYLRHLTRNTENLGDAWNHYIAEASKPEVWTKLPRYSQAQIAIVLNGLGNADVAARIVESIRQHAVESEELGMYWKDTVSLCPWHIEFASIETQAMMIELFAKVAKDEKAVAELKTRLLTQKQAQAWRASRATAEAVFALLCTTAPETENASESEALTDDEMRGKMPATEKSAKPEVFAGTQRISGDGKRFSGSEIVPALGTLKMKNPGKNPVFVSAVWSYETELDKVQNHTPSNGFKIRKSLWKKSPGRDGKDALYPIRAEMLQPGDEIVVRLVIEADRDFEFVHVKDLRASGCEPTGTRSGYRWNNAVWYYTTTSDTAEEFFFDRLPRGKHVLEYSLRAIHSGKYSAGYAEIRSLYAPEFSAHSKAATLQTR